MVIQTTEKVTGESQHFGLLSNRMNEYRESVLEKKPYICAERALLATEAYKKNQNQPNVLKRALMLQNILDKMSIYIEDQTLIVGNQAGSNRDAPIFPEYTLDFVVNELDTFEKKEMVTYSILQKKNQRTNPFYRAFLGK